MEKAFEKHWKKESWIYHNQSIEGLVLSGDCHSAIP